ncbi:hypothetical protein [Salinispira pacifica]|uniref:Uncharacterized protein n=1 Tax=Salinispira pacifica TaxID=1307761 RepID=V5WF83_9SPIO|nr:hypothetical protein [Salinispira pacifica]AHC14204.1 hypothetical protein L21SP2_0782 [Salinispira pacifica]
MITALLRSRMLFISIVLMAASVAQMTAQQGDATAESSGNGSTGSAQVQTRPSDSNGSNALPRDPNEILRELENDVLRVYIQARILGSGEDSSGVIWNMEMDELTVPGRGVKVRLNGQNLVVEVEFTPYRQENETIMLVAQGQTWVQNSSEDKLRYQTSLKSIPVDTGEPVVFYPLGVDTSNGSSVNLELEITVSNYRLSGGQTEDSGESAD